MKKILCVMTLAVMALLLTGCGKNIPECDDEETINMLKKMANDEMVDLIGQTLASHIDYSLEDIRTKYEDGKTGAFTCAADLVIISSSSGLTKKVPFTYTIQATDDGEDFYINLH